MFQRPGIRRTRGFTLLELILAIAVIAILASIGASRFVAPEARLYANDVRALVQQARYEAIKRNVPIAVLWNEGERAFQAVIGTSDLTPCDVQSTFNWARADKYRRVDVAVQGDGRLVFLPSGQARSCNFGSLAPVIATIDDGRLSLEVTVTLTGRVTTE